MNNDDDERKVIVYGMIFIIIASLIIYATCNINQDEADMMKQIITWCTASLTTILGVPRIK
ncbi:hypothetical protein E6Q11_06590 [Candidatus Dojkabacteria bacterium]|uniref:Uncharacterized protein n=1 Tax=Candidatus Dojkabacteria bacterium TaxID=2099670 RepID=A0A5C7J2S1_9BACT|nr:MAG: hypothetical protein E6Q11_06590 [Candidatus Dojkabacteria bacterium]